MKFRECVENVSTFTDLKREATYVIDYKRLNFDELKLAMLKTAPQYYNEQNLMDVVEQFELNANRDTRILFSIIIREVLLNCDDFTEKFSVTEEKVISYEQNIVGLANELALDSEVENIDFFKYVVDAAWDNNDDVSSDEQNLINKIRKRMGISEKHNQILEAQIGKFPKSNNVLHSRDEISEMRRLLQSKGLIFSVRDVEGKDYDVIPEEIADVLSNHT